MTFEERQFRPTRKPARKTAAAASTQTGQTTSPRGRRSPRATQTQRTSSHSIGGYASGIAAKMLPRLKNHNETDSDSRTSRSALRIDNGRRQSASPSRNRGQSPSHTL